MSGKSFGTKLFERKKIFKCDIAQTHGLPLMSDTFVVGLYVETPEDASFFASLREGITALEVPCVVLNAMETHVNGRMGGANETYVSAHDPHFAHMLQACDVLVCMSQRGVSAAKRGGCVPIAPEDIAGVKNYHPVTETGNAFTFAKKKSWSVFAALVRAKETFLLSFDWKGICRNGADLP